MRIAIVSDIHGNRTAFDAVLDDLRITAPDLVLHGGDLADGGSDPAYIVDRIRDLHWDGVLGNTDEMLLRPQSLRDFARQSPASLATMFDMIEEIAEAVRETLGTERLKWLGRLPHLITLPPIALVHATPSDCWRAPPAESSTAELRAAFAAVAAPIVAYAHIHRPFIRRRTDTTFVNTGSVSLSYDGDSRAAYALIDDDVPTIRRVEYHVDRECEAMLERRVPHAEWIARMLRSAAFSLPQADG